MPFPDHTITWAEEIKDRLFSSFRNPQPAKINFSSSLQKEFRDNFLKEKGVLEPLSHGTATKADLATRLFENLRFRYGFREALETDNWTPWPDESSMTNCYGQAIANYVVAKTCGLNPVLVEFSGLLKEGDAQRAGHALVVVDVGEEGKPELWTIDQAQRMYGLIRFGNNTVTVEDFSARQGKTHRRDYKIQKFEFVARIDNHEDEIVANIKALRSHPEVVLYQGQRIAIPFIDSWQTEELLEACWYLKFIPDKSENSRGDIVSRILIDRPGIKSRGLEYKITLGTDHRVKEERVLGYYCTGMVWSEFTNPRPMVDLPLEDILPLLEGLKEIPLPERAKFELELMKQSASPSDIQRHRILAAHQSFERVQQSEHGAVIVAMATAEALYQHEKGPRESYLTPGERDKETEKLKNVDPLFAFYVKEAERFKRYSKALERQGLKGKPRLTAHERSLLLRPDQIEDHRIVRFLALESEHERLEHILNHKPTYMLDAIDRLVFYNRKIKGKECQIESIARTVFRTDYSTALFAGYARIFAEFLGHFAVTLSELCLEEYKKKIINKITLTLPS